jgi:hypothetical protein
VPVAIAMVGAMLAALVAKSGAASAFASLFVLLFIVLVIAFCVVGVLLSLRFHWLSLSAWLKNRKPGHLCSAAESLQKALAAAFL